MRRLSPSPSNATRIVVFVQLACIVAGVGILFAFREQVGGPLVAVLSGIGAFIGAVSIYGWIATTRDHRAAIEMAERIAQERALTASLEQAVTTRTAELEDAQ